MLQFCQVVPLWLFFMNHLGSLYQQGLTYQAMGDNLRSGESFQAAIALFQNMDAPKQVAKVQRAMNGS
jgi:hypothetical protein